MPPSTPEKTGIPPAPDLNLDIPESLQSEVDFCERMIRGIKAQNTPQAITRYFNELKISFKNVTQPSPRQEASFRLRLNAYAIHLYQTLPGEEERGRGKQLYMEVMENVLRFGAEKNLLQDNVQKALTKIINQAKGKAALEKRVDDEAPHFDNAIRTAKTESRKEHIVLDLIRLMEGTHDMIGGKARWKLRALARNGVAMGLKQQFLSQELAEELVRRINVMEDSVTRDADIVDEVQAASAACTTITELDQVIALLHQRVKRNPLVRHLENWITQVLSTRRLALNTLNGASSTTPPTKPLGHTQTAPTAQIENPPLPKVDWSNFSTPPNRKPSLTDLIKVPEGNEPPDPSAPQISEVLLHELSQDPLKTEVDTLKGMSLENVRVLEMAESHVKKTLQKIILATNIKEAAAEYLVDLLVYQVAVRLKKELMKKERPFLTALRNKLHFLLNQSELRIHISSERRADMNGLIAFADYQLTLEAQAKIPA